MTTNRDGLQPIASILERALREAGVGERLAGRAPLLHWREIVGPEIAAHVRAVDLVDGVLMLEADHGAWRQELIHAGPGDPGKIQRQVRRRNRQPAAVAPGRPIVLAGARQEA